jgi:membrane dipeptidase
VGLVLLMEGADALRDPSELETWQRAGLRLLGPSWRATRYAGGTGEPGGLTDLGRELLREIDRLGMVLDMSHIAEESFWQALDIFSGLVIASHANCRVYVPTDRQLTDEMIRAIAACDGVIGTVLFDGFVVDGWQRGSDVPVTLDDVVRHIDHVCQLTGSARHSAVGSDFDGGFGVESTPVEFDTVADLEKLAGALERRGYSQEDVAGVLGENWLRLLQRTLPE